MSADYLKEAEEASALRPQRAEESPRRDTNGQAEQTGATRNGDLLGDSRLRGRGNEPVRVALMQDMQQTHGNRAVQRFVQRSAAGTSVSPDEEVGARIKNASGNGSSLDASAQRKLESGMGADLSGVRVHTDSEADNMARSVDAVAFTSGQDIFFRDGAYNPGSKEGMQLLAHEAVHTVQQSKGPVDGTPAPGGISVSDPSDRHEQEADRAAASVMQGGQSSAQTVGGGAAGTNVQRQEAGFDGREEEQKKKPEEDEAAVQAMRADRYPSVQRAPVDTMPAGEDMANNPAAQSSENAVEGAPAADQPLAQEDAATAQSTAAEEIAAAAIDTGPNVIMWQEGVVQETDKGKANEKFEDDEERIKSRLKSAESSGGSSARPSTQGAKPTISNSALRPVFEGSVVTPLRTVHDNLMSDSPDAQTALTSVTQAQNVAASLAATYKTQGEIMQEARLSALVSSLDIRAVALNDLLGATISLSDIGKWLNPNGVWIPDSVQRILPLLHTPEKSQAPAAPPPNAALQSIFQSAIIHVLGNVHQNLTSKTPEVGIATSDLESALNVLKTLVLTYQDAGDEYVAEELSAFYNNLLRFQVALEDHDPNRRVTLRAIGESTDPDKEPFKERIKKIVDDMR